MRVALAETAQQKRCCLELHYGDHVATVEVHAVGYDDGDRPLIVAYERSDLSSDRDGHWRLFYLDEPSDIAISVVFAELPRNGYVKDHPRLKRIVRQF